jgi:plastocyanin
MLLSLPRKSTFLAAFALITVSISTYGATAVVQMKNNFFSPATTNINVGDTVTWVQSGSNHDTVSYDGLWDSGSLRLGQTFSHTFNTAGTFNYYCTPHEAVGMKGTIIVQGAANQPPSVTLTSPANGATFLTTDTISVSATASDNGSVAKVDFFADGNPIGTDTTSPYSTSTTLSAGTHSITAKATDNLGARPLPLPSPLPSMRPR